MNCLPARKHSDAIIVINPIGPTQAGIDQRLKSIPLLPQEIITNEIFKHIDTKTYFKCSISSRKWKQTEVQFTNQCLQLFNLKPNCKLTFKDTKERYHRMDADEETVVATDQNKVVFWDLKTNKVCRKSYDHHYDNPAKKFFLRNKFVFVLGATGRVERFQKKGTRLLRLLSYNYFSGMTYFMHPTSGKKQEGLILTDDDSFYEVRLMGEADYDGFKYKFPGLSSLRMLEVDKNRKYVQGFSNGKWGLFSFDANCNRIFKPMPSLERYALNKDYIICRCWHSKSNTARVYNFCDKYDLKLKHKITSKPLKGSVLGEFRIARDKFIEIANDSPMEELYIRKIPTGKLLCKPIKIKMGTLHISYPYMAFGVDKTVQIWSLIKLTKIAQVDWEVCEYAQIRFSVVPKPYLAIAGREGIIAWNPIRKATKGTKGTEATKAT